MPLLSVNKLRILGPNQEEIVKGINLTINYGQWFSLIGESGSGKSLTAFALTALVPSTLIVEAQSIRFNQREIYQAHPKTLRTLRGAEIAYVFQDYQSTFTPYRHIGPQMDEAICAHVRWSSKERQKRMYGAITEVGLMPDQILNRYPFQLSGGQLQRASLALALLLEPKLLIADEPTTALDACSAQTVLQLIARLKRDKHCAVLFISHDLRTVRRYTDRIAIMRQGVIVEEGTKDDIFLHGKHPYTRNLLAAIPPLINPPQRLPVTLNYEQERYE